MCYPAAVEEVCRLYAVWRTEIDRSFVSTKYVGRALCAWHVHYPRESLVWQPRRIQHVARQKKLVHSNNNPVAFGISTPPIILFSLCSPFASHDVLFLPVDDGRRRFQPWCLLAVVSWQNGALTVSWMSISTGVCCCHVSLDTVRTAARHGGTLRLRPTSRLLFYQDAVLTQCRRILAVVQQDQVQRGPAHTANHCPHQLFICVHSCQF